MGRCIKNLKSCPTNFSFFKKLFQSSCRVSSSIAYFDFDMLNLKQMQTSLEECPFNSKSNHFEKKIVYFVYI